MLRLTHASNPPGTHYRAVVAQRANFVQLVADIQNAATLAAELAQNTKQALHRLRRKHRGRLIQNQQTRVGKQGADDFHPLHFTHTQSMHGALRVNRHAVGLRLLPNHFGNFGQRVTALKPQPNVLRHGKRIKQAEMLKHHGNTQGARLLRVGQMHWLAIYQYLPAIGLLHAVDDFHQRRLARAVFAQHGMNLAGLHR